MIKIAILDDYEAYAEMLAGPLLRAGHGVLIELAPLDFERLLSFEPNVISLGLYRKKSAFDRPILNTEEDIMGYEPLIEMERYPAINVIPIILIGSALEEKDVPTNLAYDLFLTFPDDLKLYLPKVEELANIVKTRRKISDYICPVCRSRLAYIQKPARDLFCPRCHTSVTIVDQDTCLYLVGSEGENRSCPLAMLNAPATKPNKAEIIQHGELYPGT